MAHEKLVQYIIEYNKKGESFERIRDFLLRSGYPQNVVEYALLEARRNITNQSAESRVTEQRSDNEYQNLLEFVKSQIKNGFEPAKIKQHLLSSGYSPDSVEKALSDGSSEMNVFYSPVKSKNKTLLAISFFLLTLLLSGTFLVLVLGDKKGIIIDYELDVLNDEVEKGTYLRFEHSYSEVEGSQHFDVKVDYFVQSLELYEDVKSWGEVVSVADLDGKAGRVIIEEDLPSGDYVLRSVVSYNGEEQRAVDNFIVFEEGEIPEKEDDNGDDPSDEDDNGDDPSDEDDNGDDPSDEDDNGDDPSDEDDNGDDPSDEDDNGDDPSDDDDNGDSGVGLDGMSTYDIIQEVKKIEDKEKGTLMCEEIANRDSRDDCYESLAQGELDNPDVCGMIDMNNKADRCYMYFVRNQNNFSLCEELFDSYIKLSCETMNRTHELEERRSELEKIVNDTLDLDDDKDLEEISGYDLQNEKCVDDECFNYFFSDCEPVNSTLIREDMSLEHEIIGEDEGLCGVSTYVVEHFNETFVDKSMVCYFDNSHYWVSAFDSTINSFSTDSHKGRCDGDLYDSLVDAYS